MILSIFIFFVDEDVFLQTRWLQWFGTGRQKERARI
jgi:hypothetical protein